MQSKTRLALLLAAGLLGCNGTPAQQTSDDDSGRQATSDDDSAAPFDGSSSSCTSSPFGQLTCYGSATSTAGTSAPADCPVQQGCSIVTDPANANPPVICCPSPMDAGLDASDASCPLIDPHTGASLDPACECTNNLACADMPGGGCQTRGTCTHGWFYTLPGCGVDYTIGACGTDDAGECCGY